MTAINPLFMPQATTGTIVRKTFLTPDTIELEIHYDETFAFASGQFVSVAIPTAPGERPCRRSYSIASSPNYRDQQAMVLCIKLVRGGQASEYFRTVNEQEPISFLGPVGHFFLKEFGVPKVFIATGTGIAPFKAMMEELSEKNDTAPLTLLFGLRSEADIFYQEWLQTYGENHPHFSFHIAISQAGSSWTGFQGRVTDHYLAHPNYTADTHFYLCGNGAMIDSMRTILSEHAVPAEQIHFEKYFT